MTPDPADHRLPMLDGWRAISILAVLAGHMLPLGPARFQLNATFAPAGMAIFFTLSGFLIVSILHRDPNVARFLTRRLARIVPLAWTALIIALAIQGVSAEIWSANLFFYANLPPIRLEDWSSHFWSLDVEMQFYAGIAVAVLILGRRGLWLVPVAALAVTALRIANGMDISIVTWFRVDEILAGGILALIIHQGTGAPAARILARIPFWPVALLMFLSARPDLPWLGYARPYLTATMVGITILRPIRGLSPLLESRAAAYIAKISYALYIIHHFTMYGWLSSGDVWIKYAKRPLALGITFALAHLSTFHFEKRFIEWSHRATHRRKST
jgi:peptidoglycan/LPS O-acetylase OafA/YrhL